MIEKKIEKEKIDKGKIVDYPVLFSPFLCRWRCGICPSSKKSLNEERCLKDCTLNEIRWKACWESGKEQRLCILSIK